MKVSIIIPAHNEALFVGKTIEAALAQTYPDFEVIVVDNNSKDATTAVAKSYPNVRVISESIQGANAAREGGRKIAQGEIIATLDADCLPDKTWLVRGVQKLTEPNIIAVSGPSYYYDLGFFFRYFSLFFQKTVYVLFNTVFSYFGIGGVLIANNCFVWNEALKKAGGFNTSIVFYGDDTDTAKRVIRYGKINFAPDFSMSTSGRRFKKLGIFKTVWFYMYYFFLVTLTKESKNS
jgi:glycosyltransferase involved in cell wall biosynthesis